MLAYLLCKIPIFSLYYPVWQYGLWSFQTGGTKLEKKLAKNQHTKRKFLNFEFGGLEPILFEDLQLRKYRRS